ncbi:C40 family peptidase [Marivibrio halodurans]|uniref:C40 family peptidase n=1 Tax=Marivibrio halodurans TaxID=2039722 RepID=A0A8J7RX06_9PROT|nr:NlpC/P60 family protein [Marivibrio halodurans]MBP5855970.1 C40 family peptidase [Marivibrio halodurans]
MASALDSRLNAYRDDLADARLRDRVSASCFVVGEDRQVTAGAAALRRKPDDGAPQDTQLLFGERVRVFEVAGDWAWVQNDRDGYVGYCRVDRLGPVGAPVTHRVAALRTYLYPDASLKVPPLDLLSVEAAVAVSSIEGRWARLDGAAGFVHADHLRAVGENAADPAAVAELFLETPYLWGGKTSVGLDCSGLVQLALHCCGIDCPRDTDMQELALGHALAGGVDAARRGDLVFWPGHVGIMLDATRILHANATDMATRIWDLSVLDTHIERQEGSRLTHIKRVREVF